MVEKKEKMKVRSKPSAVKLPSAMFSKKYAASEIAERHPKVRQICKKVLSELPTGKKGRIVNEKLAKMFDRVTYRRDRRGSHKVIGNLNGILPFRLKGALKRLARLEHYRRMKKKDGNERRKMMKEWNKTIKMPCGTVRPDKDVPIPGGCIHYRDRGWTCDTCRHVPGARAPFSNHKWVRRSVTSPSGRTYDGYMCAYCGLARLETKKDTACKIS